MKYQAISANSKIYFGQEIPNMFVEGNNSPPKSVHAANLPNAQQDFLKTEGQWVHSSVSAQDRRTWWGTCLVCEAESTEMKIMGGTALQLVW